MNDCRTPTSTPTTVTARLSAFAPVESPKKGSTFTLTDLDKIEKEVTKFAITTEEDLAIASRVQRMVDQAKPALKEPHKYKNFDKDVTTTELKLHFFLSQLQSRQPHDKASLHAALRDMDYRRVFFRDFFSGHCYTANR